MTVRSRRTFQRLRARFRPLPLVIVSIAVALSTVPLRAESTLSCFLLPNIKLIRCQNSVSAKRLFNRREGRLLPARRASASSQDTTTPSSTSSDEIPRGLRIGLALGYVILLIVNSILGAGAFGFQKTNRVISAMYPTVLTPAGSAFAIWGPIFALQLLGTVFVISGGEPAAGAAVLPAWLCGWAAEITWQFVFSFTPIPAAAAALSKRRAVFAPASVLLLVAYISMLRGAFRLSDVARSHPMTSPIAISFVLGLPTGLNAAWLAAASGIGLSLAAQVLPGIRWLATPRGGSALLGLVVSSACAVVLLLGRSPATLALGLGYAAATAWACFGVSKGQVPDAVKSTAGIGIKAAIMSGALASARAMLLDSGYPRDLSENIVANTKKEANALDFGNGLKFTEQKPGDGTTFPQKGDRVTMHYTLTLANDPSRTIDSSRSRGEPFTFIIGIGQVITGWDQGVMQMSLGQRGMLFVPSDLAYGKQGAGSTIPPDADLSFDVQVLKIEGRPSI